MSDFSKISKSQKSQSFQKSRKSQKIKTHIFIRSSNYHNIVQLTTYLVGRSSVEPYLEARAVIFGKIFKPKEQPPNTLLIIDGLLEEGMLIEIATIAAI